MSPTFYHILHVSGALLIFLAYGLLIGRAMLRSEDTSVKKLGAIVSGVGLLLMLASGFGLIAKLHYSYTAPWLLIKMAAWLGLGGMIAAINRAPHLSRIWFWAIFILGWIAVLSVYVRPGA